jgi:FAD/FMN-containing dehydrogenase
LRHRLRWSCSNAIHEVDTVVGGPTFWPVEAGAEVLSAYREFLPGALRELNRFFAFHTVPPAPPFPEAIHMRKVCGIVWCHVGGADEAADIHARFGAQMPTLKSTMHLHPIDGAAHDVASTDTAWSYRDARWASVFAGVDPDPANVGAIRDWSIGYHEALHPYSAGGADANMMMDEGEERVRASYRDNYDRLARVKDAYDPRNLFRVNQNIVPRSTRQ